MKWIKGSNPSGNCGEARMEEGRWFFRNSIDPESVTIVFSAEEWDNGRGVVLESVSEFSVPGEMRRIWAVDHPADPEPVWFGARGHNQDGENAVVYLTLSERQAWEDAVAAGKWTQAAYTEAQAALA